MVLLVEACYHHEDAPPRYESLQGLPQDTPKPRSILRTSRSAPTPAADAASGGPLGGRSEIVRDRRALLGRHRRAPPLRCFFGRRRRAFLLRRGPRRRRRSDFSSGFVAAAHGALQESGFGALVMIRAGWTRPRCDFCHCSDASIERSQCVRNTLCHTQRAARKQSHTSFHCNA